MGSNARQSWIRRDLSSLPIHRQTFRRGHLSHSAAHGTKGRLPANAAPPRGTSLREAIPSRQLQNGPSAAESLCVPPIQFALLINLQPCQCVTSDDIFLFRCGVSACVVENQPPLKEGFILSRGSQGIKLCGFFLHSLFNLFSSGKG
jgi:hypothetical protein